MKTHRWRKFSPVLFLLGVLLIAGPAVCSDPVPAEIREFYEACNYVSSFSTPQERANFFPKPKRFQDNKEQPKRSERLAIVIEKLDWIRGKIYRTDPGIEIRIPRGLPFLKPELFRIRSFRMSENSAMVHVLSFPLSGEDNASLVGWYETQSKDQEYVWNRHTAALLKNRVAHVQIHFWFFVDERWVINEKKIGLLR